MSILTIGDSFMEVIERNKPKSEQTADASKYPQGYFKSKPCRWCSSEFVPNAPSEHYCSDDCKNIGLQNRYFVRTYGITVQDYEQMFEAQSGLCMICNTEGFVMNEKRHKMKLVVDHCHSTGVVRGLLCHNCNRALGLLHDDISRFERAISYLKVQRLSKGSEC